MSSFGTGFGSSFDAASTTAKASSRAKKRKKQNTGDPTLDSLPPLTPEQESTLLEKALGGGVSGLQWVGEALDKPRRSLYGALAGKREALNFIPFSDTLGITDPAETITGRDALEAAGILGPNQEGLDWGDVTGFAVELPTDPFNMLGLGVAGKAAKGASAASNIADAARIAGKTPAGRLKELSDGTASLLRVTTPDIGIPFTKYKLPVKELYSFSGKPAADAYELLNYGKFSPVPHVRKVFSTNELLTQNPIENQKAIDEMADIFGKDTLKSYDDVVELAKLNSKAVKAHETLRTDTVFGGDMGVKRAKARAVGQFAAIDPQFKKTLDQRMAPLNNSDLATTLDPTPIDDLAIDNLAKIFDDTQDVKNGYGKFGEELSRKLTSMREDALEGMANAPVSEQHWFNDTVGQLFEADPKTGLRADDYAKVLKDAGYADNLESFNAARDAFEGLVSHVRTKLPEFHKKLTTMGVDIGKFTDLFMSYAPRTASKNYAKDGFDITAGRSNMIGKMPRLVVNKLARMLGGINKDKAHAKQMLDGLDINSLEGTRVVKEPSKNSPARALWEAAKQNDVDFAEAMDHVNNVRNAERQTQQAMRDIYIESAAANFGSNWMTYIAGIRKNAGANFDPMAVRGFDEVVQSVSHRLGKPADAELAQDVWDKLSHQNPVSRFNPRKLSDPTLIDEAISVAAKQKAARAAQMADEGIDDFAFGDKAVSPIGKPSKWSDEVTAQVLVREGVKWNGHFTKNMREAMANHYDADFANVARNAVLDDDAFKQALFDTAKAKGLYLSAENADDMLELMNQSDEVLKGQGGYSWSEIKDLAKWFGDLSPEIRKTGFFDRDAVHDVMDYIQQAYKKIAQASIVRAALKNPQFIGKLGENGNDISMYDVWKSAGFTDDGLLSLVAETKGIDFAKRIDELENAIKNASATDKQTAIKELNDFKASLFDAARTTGVSSGMARGIVNTGKVFTGQNQPSWLGKLADRFRSILQAGLYVPWLASHNRNHIGGVAINAIAGAFDVQSYADAYKLYRGQNLNDEFMRQIVTDAVATGILKSSHPTGFTAQQLLEDLQRSIDNPGSFTAGKGLLATLADPMKIMMGQVKDTYKAKGIKAAAKQAMFGGETVDGLPATGLANFWEVRGGLSPGDAKRQMGAVDASGRKLDTLDRWKSTETRILPMQVGEQLGAYVEFQNRMQAFINLRRKGWDAHAAALKVKEIHFDYGDLNSFEKRVIRRNVMFWDFMRKNLELQSKLLITQPGGATSKIIRAENRIQEEAKGKEGFVPSHLREGFSVRLPGEVEGFPGTSRYWSQTGLLPIEEALGRFQFDRTGFPLSIKRTAEKFASQLAPWYSAPIEQFAGRQLSTGRPLKDLYQFPSGDPDVDFWLQKTPFSRAIGTVRTLADPRKSVAQKAFNLTVGGARVTDVNVPTVKLLEGRRAIQEQLSSDKDIGTFESLYAKDLTSLVERAKGGDDSALQQLQLYQQLRQGIRELRKQQAGETAKPKKR